MEFLSWILLIIVAVIVLGGILIYNALVRLRTRSTRPGLV